MDDKVIIIGPGNDSMEQLRELVAKAGFSIVVSMAELPEAIQQVVRAAKEAQEQIEKELGEKVLVMDTHIPIKLPELPELKVQAKPVDLPDHRYRKQRHKTHYKHKRKKR